MNQLESEMQRLRKTNISKITLMENEEAMTKREALRFALVDKVMVDFEKIANTDANGMLSSISKELKLTDYTLKRCVTAGTDHF